MTMKSYQMVALGSATVRETREPSIRPGHVIIAPEAAGVCGTDLHGLHEGVYIDLDEGLPVTMGHEVVGVIAEAADDVSGYVVGDRVVVEPVLNCGACDNCRRGRLNLCSNWTHLGFDVHGVWAERVLVPAARITKISQDVPAEIATLAEPLACSLHFLSLARVELGQSLLILGGGPSGQLALVAALAIGAGPVVLSDPHPERRALALQLGASAVIDARGENVGERVDELTGGEGFDVIFEIAGSESSVAQAFELAKPGGMVLLGGVCGQKELSVNTQHIVRNEVTVQGAFASRWQMANAVKLLERDDLDFSPIVGLKLPWTEAGTALSETSRRKDICKVVLMFDESER